MALLNAIARLDDSCHIEVLALPPCHMLLAEMPCVSRLHVRPKNKVRDILLELKLLLRKWDVAIVTRETPPLELFIRAARATHKRARRRLGYPSSEQEIITRLRLLDGVLAGWDEDINTKIHFNDRRVDDVLDRLKLSRSAKLLTVSPGASGPTKTWDKDNFVELINALKPKFDTVVTVGSESERELCGQIAERTEGISAGGELELLDICALLSRSSLHVGNDSGLAHVAAGAGAICVVAIGDYGLGRYKPVSCGGSSFMIEGKVEDISVAQVLELLDSKQLL